MPRRKTKSTTPKNDGSSDDASDISSDEEDISTCGPDLRGACLVHWAAPAALPPLTAALELLDAFLTVHDDDWYVWRGHVSVMLPAVVLKTRPPRGIGKRWRCAARFASGWPRRWARRWPYPLSWLISLLPCGYAR